MIKLNTHTLRAIFNSQPVKERQNSSIAGFLFQNDIRLVPGHTRGYTLKFRSDKEETLFKLRYSEYL